MKAILLAAGIGSRLGELTRQTPKCLLPIGGRPLLDYWFESLRRYGVTDVFINLHHLPEQVEAYLETQPHGISSFPFYEETLLGSAGTLARAREFVGGDETFLIIYADNFAQVDLNRLIRFHHEKGNPELTLVAYRADNPMECGIVELDGDGKVVSFEEKPAHPRTEFANSGIHAASRRLFDFLPTHAPADIGFDVLPRLVGRMYGYVTDEYIRDVGTPSAYQAVQDYLTAAG